MVEQHARKLADELSVMANEPALDRLPQFHVFMMFRLVVSQRLICISMFAVLILDSRILMENVVEHCLTLVREQQPHILADNLKAKRVHGADNRSVFARNPGVGKSLFNVGLQLLRDDPIKSNNED